MSETSDAIRWERGQTSTIFAVRREEFFVSNEAPGRAAGVKRETLLICSWVRIATQPKIGDREVSTREVGWGAKIDRVSHPRKGVFVKDKRQQQPQQKARSRCVARSALMFEVMNS